MNCQLCKYRTQIIGYVSELGAPQAGHHHHVRGIGGNGTAHEHTHEDGHHHHDDEAR
jgi:sirohydrochlorin cobaltochelatase